MNYTLFDATATAMQPIMPNNLARLLNAVAMKRFDPMIGYSFVMAITAGLVQKIAKLRITNAYESELSLFFLTIAPSGAGKGAVSAPILNPLRNLILERHEEEAAENQRRQRHNSALLGVIAAKKKAGRRLSGPALDNHIREIEQLEAQLVPELPFYLFDAQDVTTAALLKDLHEQEGHSLVILDAEGRFMRSLVEDKPLASLLNQAFVGEEVSNRRVSGKSMIVNNPHISITAAIQPDKLKSLARHQNLWGEGFIPRTLPYFAWPASLNGPAVGEIDDSAIMDWWTDKITSLFNIPMPINEHGRADRNIVELDSEAKAIFEEWARSVQIMKTNPAYMGLDSNLSRLPNVTARIAAIYHFLEHPTPLGGKVSGEMMRLAINATQFFIPYMQQLYAWFNPDPMWEIITVLIEWLKSRCGTTKYVTLKDLYAACGSKKVGFQKAVRHLCSIGALQPVDKYTEHIKIFEEPKFESSGFFIHFNVLENYNF